jgi:hypothetical protein
MVYSTYWHTHAMQVFKYDLRAYVRMHKQHKQVQRKQLRAQVGTHIPTHMYDCHHQMSTTKYT